MDRVEGNGFDVILMPEMVRSVSPLTDWHCYGRLCTLLQKIQPDIVHTHSSKAGVLGRAAAGKLKLPCVHTVHGASFHYGQSPLVYRTYVAAEKWAAKRTDRFICVADDMTDTYVSAGIAPRTKFTTVYSGFDVEPFLSPRRSREEVRTELGFRPDDVVIGKIARLFPLKGHEFLLKSAQRIVADHSDARFLLVGDGILRAEIEQSLAAMGIDDRFTFTGLVEPEQIPELIHAMDIVTHTSQWEGLARVLPQGLVSGKPVVSFDVGGAREVVIPDETGFLVPRDDVEELTSALKQLISDPSLRARLGQEGRARFIDQFRHQSMTAAIRSVYRKVLESRNRAASVPN